jgi:hypothetical protein
MMTCEKCNGTGYYTHRTTFPCSYVGPGRCPDDARGMTDAECRECMVARRSHAARKVSAEEAQAELKRMIVDTLDDGDDRDLEAWLSDR